MDRVPQMKWPYSVVMFWPTVLFARLWSWLLPQQRRVLDRIPGTPLVVGAVPLWSSDFALLQSMGVKAVVNMCAEWSPDVQQLQGHGLHSLHVPVVDMTPPSQLQLIQCATWITRELDAARSDAGDVPLVYVHCKAGRGRSVLVAAACLMAWGGWLPPKAAQRILAARPHASDKSRHPALLQLQETLQAPSQAELVTVQELREDGPQFLAPEA